MASTQSMRHLGVTLWVLAVGLSVGACNTTQSHGRYDRQFFSSTSPNELFTSDGMIVKEQKINLFAGGGIRKSQAGSGSRWRAICERLGGSV